MQWIPIANAPATVIVGLIDVGQGNFSDAGMNLIDLIPFGKGLRTADKIGDATKAGQCLLCFVAGTLVQTTEGLKPIEEIEVGDKVLSYNELTKKNEYQVVYYTFKRFADDIYAIKIENEPKDLEVTSEHPFYIKIHQARDDLATNEDDEGYWEEVRNLEIGDEIRLANGRWAKILDIKFKGLGEVFNFSVAGNNNYYVGESKLLTHNAGCPFPDPDEVAARIPFWEKFKKWATSDEAEALRLGYGKRIPANKSQFNSHGQEVFTNGKTFITRDVDGHNVGNGWKMFDRSGTRLGTFDQFLKYIKK